MIYLKSNRFRLLRAPVGSSWDESGRDQIIKSIVHHYAVPPFATLGRCYFCTSKFSPGGKFQGVPRSIVAEGG